MKSMSMLCIWVSCTGLLLLLQMVQTDAQAYHFSNGWQPGKKRAASPAASSMVRDLSSQVPITGYDEAGVQVPAGILAPHDKCPLLPHIHKALTDMIQSTLREFRQRCAGGTHREAAPEWTYNNKLRQISNWLLKGHGIADEDMVNRK